MSVTEKDIKTRSLILSHYNKYPDLQIIDLFKFLYQSSFGCEHLVLSIENVTDYIINEYSSVSYDKPSIIEPLDGDYCRVPLSVLDNGLSPKTLGKLFYLSAKKESDGILNLKQKIEILRELIEEKQLPFSIGDFENAKNEWQEKGYSAIHHSNAFNNKYNPSYRVISNRFIPFLPLFSEIDKLLEKGNAKIAVEGGSASGKSTLSELLEEIYDCTVFHMDDFFLQHFQRTPERFAEIGGNIDRERFLLEVLLPLNEEKTVKYRKFDCSAMSLGETVIENPKKLCVIEGAYSMHPELSKYYDFSVFLDISKEFQKKRILKRNSPELAKRFFDEWIPMEEKYFNEIKIKEKCNITIRITE